MHAANMNITEELTEDNFLIRNEECVMQAASCLMQATSYKLNFLSKEKVNLKR